MPSWTEIETSMTDTENDEKFRRLFIIFCATLLVPIFRVEGQHIGVHLSRR